MRVCAACGLDYDTLTVVPAHLKTPPLSPIVTPPLTSLDHSGGSVSPISIINIPPSNHNDFPHNNSFSSSSQSLHNLFPRPQQHRPSLTIDVSMAQHKRNRSDNNPSLSARIGATGGLPYTPEDSTIATEPFVGLVTAQTPQEPASSHWRCAWCTFMNDIVRHDRRCQVPLPPQSCNIRFFSHPDV